MMSRTGNGTGTTGPSLLRVRDLCRPGLAPVSFDLGHGECLAVHGPSGSGKTLLLRAIADLDPNSGQVLLGEARRETMPAPRWRRRVALVPTEPGWWTDTVGGHFPDWDAAAPLAGALGLPADCHGWPVQRLSTGERQRLGLIRALVLRPSVLLLDEPTSGLDGSATAAVEALIGQRREDGVGIVWVTHDRQQAGRLAGRSLVVEAGTVRVSAP